MKLILKWLVCVASIFLVSEILPGYVTVNGGIESILAAGTILWLVNIIIKPFAQFVSIIFTLLTFGLFSLVVNAGMVALADTILPSINFANFWICLLIALIITILNMILIPKKKSYNK